MPEPIPAPDIKVECNVLQDHKDVPVDPTTVGVNPCEVIKGKLIVGEPKCDVLQSHKDVPAEPETNNLGDIDVEDDTVATTSPDRPGILTTEFWQTALSTIAVNALTILSIFKLAPASIDSAILVPIIALLSCGITIFLNWKYIDNRTKSKLNAIRNALDFRFATSKSIGYLRQRAKDAMQTGVRTTEYWQTMISTIIPILVSTLSFMKLIPESKAGVLSTSAILLFNTIVVIVVNWKYMEARERIKNFASRYLLNLEN